MPTDSSRSLIDLDHPMLKVHDLEQARQAFQRLGFTVTPLRSNEPMGGGSTGGLGGNHMVMLTPQTDGTTNMLELAYADPAHAWPALQTLLGGPEGIALLVHSPRSAVALRDEWEAAGIECDPVFEVRNTFTDPETGHQDLIHFRVAQPSGRDWLIPFGAAEIFDFEHYLRADWRAHDNGAIFWSDIELIVPASAIESGLAHLRKVYAVDPALQADGTHRLQIHRLRLHLLNHEQARERHPGISLRTRDAEICHTALTIQVADVAATRQLLEERRVPHAVRDDGSLAVAPAEACGTLLNFVQAAS